MPCTRRTLAMTDNEQPAHSGSGPAEEAASSDVAVGPLRSRKARPERPPSVHVPGCSAQLVGHQRGPPAARVRVCPLSSSLGKMAGNRKMAASQKDTGRRPEAAGRSAQLELTLVRTGSPRFDVLALSWRPCRGGLSVPAVTEVSGPRAPWCSHVSEPAASENWTTLSGPTPDPLTRSPAAGVASPLGNGTHTAARVTAVRGKPRIRSPR